MTIMKQIFLWARKRHEAELRKRYGGTQTCPWCRQCAQMEPGWSFTPWEENLFHDVLTCGVCGGTSVWHFAIGMMWVGPLHPPKPAFVSSDWMPPVRFVENPAFTALRRLAFAAWKTGAATSADPDLRAAHASAEQLLALIPEQLGGDRTVQQLAEAIPLILQVLAEEGATVTLTGSNPDFNGLPDEAVTVCNAATDWKDRTYRAASIAECMRSALRGGAQ